MGYNIRLNKESIKSSYNTLYCNFKITTWSQVYLNINLSHVGDAYWDGVSLQGICDSFESYFQSLFPLSLKAYEGCADGSLIIPEKTSYSGDVIAVSEWNRDKEIIRWELGDQIDEGVHRLYYLVKSPEPVLDDLVWAIVFSTDTPADPTTYQEVARLRITRDYMQPGCWHLETLRVRIKTSFNFAYLG